MQRFDFLRSKYGTSFLIDLGRIESLPNYVLSPLPHYLSFYEIIFISKGSGTFYLDNQPITIAPQRIIFTAPYQSRVWQAKDAVEGVSLFFEQEFISSFFQDKLFIQKLAYFNPLSNGNNKLLLDYNSFAKCWQLLKELEGELSSLRADSSHIFRSVLYYLLVYLNRQFTGQERKVPSNKEQLYFAFQRLLEDKITEWHRLQEYARSLEVSPPHLSELVQEVSGQNATQLIRERLLLEAKRKLLYSYHTVSEVAFELGFSDVSNFNRFFKQGVGCTPNKFRESQQDHIN